MSELTQPYRAARISRGHLRYLVFALPLILLALIWFGLWYADDRGIPRHIALSVLPALLLELALYFLSGVTAVRDRLAALAPARAALVIASTAPISYAVYSIPLGLFSWLAFFGLFAAAAVASFWYVVTGPRSAADICFLLLMAGPIISDVFELAYLDPAPRLPMNILGRLMWYRIGILAVLAIRRMDGIGFGFLPQRADWAIGLRNFLGFIGIGLAAAILLDFVSLRPVAMEPRTLLLAVATFLGTLWVLAVAEEFFFRGLLQQLLTRALRSPVGGLLLASVIFGLAHLWYREFPNWQFALLATLAGLFYGRAYQQAGSIRAPMVTHALVVTAWRVFLS